MGGWGNSRAWRRPRDPHGGVLLEQGAQGGGGTPGGGRPVWGGRVHWGVGDRPIETPPQTRIGRHRHDKRQMSRRGQFKQDQAGNQATLAVLVVKDRFPDKRENQ